MNQDLTQLKNKIQEVGVMENVQIIGKVYMTLINHELGHYKFYRMTKLDNGQWLQQNGKIGTEGAKRLFDNSICDKKYWEKIDKGYKNVSDPTPHHIELGLNHFGLSSIEGVVSQTGTTDQETIKPDKAVDEEKVKSILDRIDKVLYILGDYISDKPDDNDFTRIFDYIDVVTKIRINVEEHQIFTTRDIELMNKIYNEYSKEEQI